MTHTLKTWPEPFRQVRAGNKRFEYRKNDRDFKEGDRVVLQEWEPEIKEYTGEEQSFRIGYLLEGGQFGIPEGYCIFQLEEIIY